MNGVYKESCERRLKLRTLTNEDFEDSQQRRFLGLLGTAIWVKPKPPQFIRILPNSFFKDSYAWRL